MKRIRFSSFLYPYLLCALVLGAFTLVDAFKDVSGKGEQARPFVEWIESLGLAALLALLSIPIRILLGLFQERSPSPWIRFIRRLIVGAACGPLPIMSVVLLSGGNENGGTLLGISLLFGALVGLGDSLSVDRLEAQGEHQE